MTEHQPPSTRAGAPAQQDRDGSDLVVIVPVLARPHRIAPFLESLAGSGVDGAHVAFMATEGDDAVIDEIRRTAVLPQPFGAVTYSVVDRHARGDYAIKVNIGYRMTFAPFMLLAADDLRFHPGWWPAARRLFDDPRIGVVGTNDLGSRRVMDGTHATHPVVRRAYIDQHGTIDEPGKVLHQGYWHEYVDDEFVATAKYRGAYAHAADSLVEHLHPSWGKAPTDQLYAQQERRMVYGRRVFNRRRRLWNG